LHATGAKKELKAPDLPPNRLGYQPVAGHRDQCICVLGPSPAW
jgi:hypothetical protein